MPTRIWLGCYLLAKTLTSFLHYIRLIFQFLMLCMTLLAHLIIKINFWDGLSVFTIYRIKEEEFSYQNYQI